MASVPARQLNSKSIRSALVSRILPVASTCSLISAKVSFRKCDGRPNTNPDELWLQICSKRDECDQAIKNIPGMAFFFSAVSAVESRVKKDPRNEVIEEEGGDAPNAKKVIFWPAILYWIAVQSQNGTHVSTVPIHSALLETGMDITAKILPDCKKGKEEESSSPLCTTLKDHSNEYLQKKVDLSFAHGLEILRDQLMEEPLGEAVHGTEQVVRLQVISNSFCSTLRDKGIPALIRAGLRFDVYGIGDCSVSSVDQTCTQALASPIVVAINDVERAMKKLGYALYKGEVYKKVGSSKYTYQHCCTVKKFLSLLGNSDHFKEIVIKHLNKLDSILGDPQSEFSNQLKINFDLIEVSDGYCFSVSKRRFVVNAIKDADVGKETPRAFVDYKHDKTPDPVYFKQILQNSLSESEMKYFCEYYIRLLNCGIKQHKEKIHRHDNKTEIVQQKPNTQIIFMDECYAKLLDPDDWKVLTQGGLTAHDRKYKSSTPLTVRCPMFITCQKEMDFGEDHNSAMNVRLRKFFFKTLTTPPVAGVMQYLKENAMECIAWASSVAETPDDELPPPAPGTVYENSPFDETEKERIRNLKMDESESDVATDVDETAALESDEETEGTASEDEGGAKWWEKSLEDVIHLRDQQPVDSLKERQLGLIAAGVRCAVNEREREAVEARERVLEETRERWVSLGMLREHAHLLKSVEGPYHPEVERSRNEYFARKKEEEQRTLEIKAREYYEDEWVLAKEKELRDLQMREDTATDVEVKRALEYMVNLTADALKSRFQREEVPGLSKFVLLERKRKAVEMNWLSPQQAEHVKSIWCPLPYPPRGVDDDWYEQQLFITPSTTNASCRRSQTPRSSSQKRRSRKTGQSSSQPPKMAKITHYFRPSQP
ncbi:hypothetical protein ACROYT_G015628 [Oculina patagonica]